MGKLLHFPVRPRRPSLAEAETAALVVLDREIAGVEESLVNHRGWARSLRGAQRQRVERARLRLAGPELALVPRGPNG